MRYALGSERTPCHRSQTSNGSSFLASTRIRLGEIFLVVLQWVCVCLYIVSFSLPRLLLLFLFIYVFTSLDMYTMRILLFSFYSSLISIPLKVTLSPVLLPSLPSSSSKSHARIALPPHHPKRLLWRRRQKQNRLTEHITNNHQRHHPHAQPRPPSSSPCSSPPPSSSPQRHQPSSIHHPTPMCLQIGQQRRTHHRQHHRSVPRPPSLLPSSLSPKPRLVQLL